MRFDAILFDIDATLSNSTGAVVRTWHAGTLTLTSIKWDRRTEDRDRGLAWNGR
jgi:hypothetical protein